MNASNATITRAITLNLRFLSGVTATWRLWTINSLLWRWSRERERWDSGGGHRGGGGGGEERDTGNHIFLGTCVYDASFRIEAIQSMRGFTLTYKLINTFSCVNHKCYKNQTQKGPKFWIMISYDPSSDLISSPWRWSEVGSNSLKHLSGSPTSLPWHMRSSTGRTESVSC